MSMPFYVSPEQMMKDRADYARKGIARGRALVALQTPSCIVIVAENPSTTLRKVSEIYDRIAFAGYLVSGTASSNIGRVTSHAVSLSDSAQADQQVVLGSVDTPGASITASQANNSERGLWASSPGADDLPLSPGPSGAQGLHAPHR